MTYMLDTNICIYVLKRSPIEVYRKFVEHANKDVCISVITLAELQHGVFKSDRIEKNAENLEKLMRIISVLPFENSCAKEYGKICAHLQKSGTPIGIMDMLIAAHAKALDYTLVTNNVREFERVPGLKIENWI